MKRSRVKKLCDTSILFILTCCSVLGQDFSSFLARIYASSESQRTMLVDSMMSGVRSFPLVESDTLTHFLFRGNATSVTVPGDANNWSTGAYSMTRIANTDLWYYTKSFEPDARLDYKFVLNGSTWILDPKNPFQVSGGFGPNSELRMPKYFPPTEIEFNSSIPHGTLTDTTFTSLALNNARMVRVYLPPGYEASTTSYNVALFHDGLEYVSLARVNNTLDNLIAAKKIPPMIAVFVPPVNRTAEYRTSQLTQFCAFITQEIIPAIDAKYRTKKTPAGRAVIGASDGGNVSLYLALNYANIFGNVAAQSSNIVSSISQGFQNGVKLNLRCYLDLGTYDIPQLIPLVRNFIPILQSKGYEYFYREYHEGHSWGNWRAHVDDALIFFFGNEISAVVQNQQPSCFALQQNFPNPFSVMTSIRCELDASAGNSTSGASLQVLDVFGREIYTAIVEGNGMKEMIIQRRALPSSGVYFYRLIQGNNQITRILFAE